MPLGVLQHFTIEPADLERSKAFYCDVLGLEDGHRPAMGFPGYWLYSGGIATVHLLGKRDPGEGIVVRGPDQTFENTGRIDHIAFAATDLPGVRRRLQSTNVAFREQVVLDGELTRIFLHDPDSVAVELNFPKDDGDG
jgi:catechol 2,3-dioxygenase-like lactoylglutathione lyase family enzyme